jgi:hypothetical protein
MHERCGEDFEGFNASDRPGNAGPREREKVNLVKLCCAVLYSVFFFTQLP